MFYKGKVNRGIDMRAGVVRGGCVGFCWWEIKGDRVGLFNNRFYISAPKMLVMTLGITDLAILVMPPSYWLDRTIIY